MSLINQMLRDLEQRRTVEAGPSPLGGLSASGSVSPAINFSVNYLTLAIMISVVFVVGVVVAYLLGSHQQLPIIESPATLLPEKEMTTPATEVRQTNIMQRLLPVVGMPIASTPKKEIAKPVPEKSIVVVSEKPVVEKIVVEVPVVEQAVAESVEQNDSIVISSASKITWEENQSEIGAGINKTIRPLTFEQQSQQAFLRAVSLLGNGNQLGAKLALEESLSYSQAHLRARETLVAILLNDGRISEAASTLRDGLRLMPDAAPLAKLYARILVDQSAVAQAVIVLERAKPEVSADPEYYALLAALYRQEKKHGQSAQVYQRILMQRPGVASWWMGLGLSQDAMGENEKAVDAFRRAQRAGGLNAQVLQYIQSRIVALTPVAVDVGYDAGNDADEFEE